MFPTLRIKTLQKSYKRTHVIKHHFHSQSELYLKCIEKCAQNRSLVFGKALHAQLIINRSARLTHFGSKLISMYIECGNLNIARQLFDEMPKSNYRKWIVLIGAYAKCGFQKQALDLLWEMQVKEGVRPNNYVLPSALKACGHLSRSRTGEEIHGLILRCSFEGDVYVCSALIDMYCKCGFIEIARRVFDNMIGKDVVALNALVAGYVHRGVLKEAMNLVQDVDSMGLKPNVVTWNTLLAGFSRAGDSLMVDELFQLMRGNGIEPDVVSWTSIISGLVQNFSNNEAFVTFRKMMESGCLPTTNTISSILSACANVVNVTMGKEIHGYALVVGIEQDVYVKSALIDMYAKCGCIVQASTLFQNTTRRNTPTWNSMIFGYASHGYFSEAIELFKKMEVEETEKLDHLTFTAVLTASSHAGMVELGRHLFKSMQEMYNIKPRLEHYACMVDLLGRAGELGEAYDIIKGMPMQPDLYVWGALLGACKQHGNLELAEVAAKRLSELEPEGAGPSLLSNLYAGAGSWRHAARVKKQIKKKKLKNLQGCSWVEGAAA